MSTFAIVVIVLAAILVIFFAGGLTAARRRARAFEGDLVRRIAAADRALEAARAADRGWDRALLEEAAREALRRERPDFRYENLHLELVDDRPGTEEDRAQMGAIGDDGRVQVVLVRSGDAWVAHSVA